MLDTIGLHHDNWTDREARDGYLNAWCNDLDAELESMAADFVKYELPTWSEVSGMEDLLGEAVINLGLLAGFLLILGIGGLIATTLSRISRSLRSIWTAFPSEDEEEKEHD